MSKVIKSQILFSQSWRLVAITSIFIPALSAILIIVLLPESPRWLLSKNRKDEAKTSLLRLRGLDKENQRFTEEFDAMVSYNDFKYTNQSSISTIEVPNASNANHAIDIKHPINNNVGELVKEHPRSLSLPERIENELQSCIKTLKIPQVWKPFIIINVFFMAQQFCGIYVILAYTVDFLTRVGVRQDPNVISVLVGLMQIASCFLLMILGDK